MAYKCLAWTIMDYYHRQNLKIIMVSFRFISLALVNALLATAQLPNGGNYLVSNNIPGNMITQFLTVFNSLTIPGSKVVTTPLNNFPPPPNQLWNFQQLGNDGSYGLYFITSLINPSVFFAIGTANGSPAVVAQSGSVFNVSDAGNGKFLIAVVNTFANNQNSGFVLTSNSKDTNLTQQSTSIPRDPANPGQLWSIVRQ